MVSYKLKILSGPLFGMDIRLPASDVFFVAGNGVADESAVADPAQAESAAHVNGFAMDSLYLPLAEAAPNFTLSISEGNEEQPRTLVASVLDETSPGEPQGLPFNEPVQIGKVWLAVASLEDAWSNAVATFRTPAPEIETPRDAGQDVKHATDIDPLGGTELVPAAPMDLIARNDALLARLQRLLTKRSTPLIGIVLVACLIIAVTARPFLAPKTEAQAEVQTQALTVAGATALTGKDQRLYFITDDSMQTSAVLRALASPSSASHAGAVVISREDLETRIEKMLERHTVDFFKVRLHDVRNPRVLARTGISHAEAAQQSAQKELLAAFPFIQSFTFQSTSLEEIQTYAVRALQRAGATFDISNDDPLSFLVKMPASDYALAALRDQIKDFRSRWDTRRTTFGGVSTDSQNQNWLITKEGVGVQLSKNQTLWNFGATKSSEPSTTF